MFKFYVLTVFLAVTLSVIFVRNHGIFWNDHRKRYVTYLLHQDKCVMRNVVVGDMADLTTTLCLPKRPVSLLQTLMIFLHAIKSTDLRFNFIFYYLVIIMIFEWKHWNTILWVMLILLNIVVINLFLLAFVIVLRYQTILNNEFIWYGSAFNI